MSGRIWIASAATSAVIVACNALTGIGSLAVDSEEPDASAPITEAGPAPTTTATLAPPDAASDASVDADAGTIDASTHHYEVVVLNNTIGWEDAKNAAAAKGGHLATITSAAEKDVVVGIVVAAGGAPNDYGPWLGGWKPQGSIFDDAGQPEPYAGWAWITGEPWSYTNWDDGQPDDTDGYENYLGCLGDAEDGTWNDYPADSNGYVFSYLIEYE